MLFLIVLLLAAGLYALLQLNSKVEDLIDRVGQLERRERGAVRTDPTTGSPIPQAPAPAQPVPPAPAAQTTTPPATAPPAAQQPSTRQAAVTREHTHAHARLEPREPMRIRALGNKTVEEVVSENLLAIVGGALVLAGVVFFLGLAISRGWIGETGRVLIVLATGAALTAAGARLGERVGAAREGRDLAAAHQWAFGSLHGVVAGTGVAAMFMGTVVGTRVYDVLGPAGLFLALLIGTVCTWIATRWNSPDLAAFGIVGALAAPILVDAPASGQTLVFVTIALVAALAVAVRERWTWLLMVALVVSAPQLAAWIETTATPDVIVLPVVVALAWNVLMLGAAMASELRVQPRELRTSIASVTTLAATMTAVNAAIVAYQAGNEDLRPAVIALIAVLHIVAAIVLITRRAAIGTETGVWCLLIAAAAAAAAITDTFDGPGVVWWWALQSVGLLWLYTRARDLRAGVMAAAFAVLAFAHVIVLDAPPDQLALGAYRYGQGSSEPVFDVLFATGAIAVSAALGAWLTRTERDFFVPLSLVSAVALIYGASIALVTVVDTNAQEVVDYDAQRALVAFWAAIAVVLAALSGRLLAAWTWLGLALGALAPIWLLATGGLLTSTEEWNTRAVVTLVFAAAAVVAAAVANTRSTFPALLLSAGWLAYATLVLLLPLELLPDAFTFGSRAPAFGWLIVAGAAACTALAHLRTGAVAGVIVPNDDAGRLWRMVTFGLAAGGSLMALVAISDTVVSLFTADGSRVVEQDAQTALSITWGVIGVIAFVASATSRMPDHLAQGMRRGALALLGVAVAKVVLLDTSQLDSTLRVLVFVAVGLLLLLGAWLDQRLRSGRRPPPS